MSLSPGQEIGPYKILERAGAGGMGEVYKAHDTRLDRTVAIKVLPALYQNNSDLQARFEREAKAISRLNHPNICTLYDVGHENGAAYLVLEYLEGETLSKVLERGPLPAEEAIKYGIQIADALERAHKQGLVHRDLKPANIILTKDGAKLLDFGLAKLQIHDGVVEGMSGATQASPLTGQGTILGTIQYMSPEQLDGKDVDQRSDVFAFGAVLYEMVTGQRAFQGSSQASVIAAIIKEKPRAIADLQPLSPPMLERAILQCLEKDPDQRWHSAGDLKRTLQWVQEGGSQVGIPIPVSVRRKKQLGLSWLVAAVALVAAVVLAYLYFSVPTTAPQVTRYSISGPAELKLINWPRVSPDGSMIAFLATDSLDVNRIWIKPTNALEAYPLAGTEGVGRPFWSPDSKYLAFIDGRQLKKIPAQGGPAVLISETPDGADGCWGSKGTIIFDGDRNDSIRQVSASGGTPVAATKLDRSRGDRYHAWPWFLPDGEHFLFIAHGDSTAGGGQEDLLRVASLDGSIDKPLFKVASRVEYSSAGYIIHARDGILFARRFDPDKLEVSGESIPIAQDISIPNGDRADFSISNNGVLSYMVGGVGGLSHFVWYDRSGRELEVEGDPGVYEDLSLSPDGKRLAYSVTDSRSSTSDIWIRDLERKVASRLTFDPANEIWPIWSTDGSRIAYASDATGDYDIMERQANGLGEPRIIHQASGSNEGPSQYELDGNNLIGVRYAETASIYRFNLTDTSEHSAVIATPHNDTRGQISPDGRFIAYLSNETESSEVYVRELSASGGKWQVSPDNGFSPKWRADGKELIYYTSNGDYYAVPVGAGDGYFRAGVPQKLFNKSYRGGGIVQYRYDMTPDAQKFIVNVPVTAGVISKIVVVANWAEELEKD